MSTLDTGRHHKLTHHSEKSSLPNTTGGIKIWQSVLKLQSKKSGEMFLDSRSTEQIRTAV